MLPTSGREVPALGLLMAEPPHTPIILPNFHQNMLLRHDQLISVHRPSPVCIGIMPGLTFCFQSDTCKPRASGAPQNSWERETSAVSFRLVYAMTPSDFIKRDYIVTKQSKGMSILICRGDPIVGLPVSFESE